MLFLVRLGEITVKSRRTRRRFEKLLVRNIKDALVKNGFSKYSIRREWGRFFVEVEGDASDTLRRVFGITSISPAEELEYSDLQDLVNEVSRIVVDKIKGRSFAVRARRVGENRFTSLDVERALGDILSKKGGMVNLSNPEVVVGVEIRHGKAYVFTEKIEGFGGLPVGCEGRFLALISGGFDSAVAAWFMLKRGGMVDFLFFNLGGFSHLYHVLSVAKILAQKWSYGYRPVLIEVNFGHVLSALRKNVPEKYWNIVLKRMMYRVGDRIASKEGYEGLVTGESLGQVSSQTARNLRIADSVTTIPVYRPLIGFDKNEIVRMAQTIGTYEASSRTEEYCALVPRHPVTWPSPREIEDAEKNLNIGQLMEASLKTLKKYDVWGVKLDEILPKDVEIDFIPDNAVVVDLREREDFEKRHLPGAINMSPGEALLGNYDEGRIYVFYCERGVTSKLVAEELRKRGVKAFSLRGGWLSCKARLGS